MEVPLPSIPQDSPLFVKEKVKIMGAIKRGDRPYLSLISPLHSFKLGRVFNPQVPPISWVPLHQSSTNDIQLSIRLIEGGNKVGSRHLGVCVVIPKILPQLNSHFMHF